MAEVVNLDRVRRERDRRAAALHELALQLDILGVAGDTAAMVGHAALLLRLAETYTGRYREALAAGAEAIVLLADLKS